MSEDRSFLANKYKSWTRAVKAELADRLPYVGISFEELFVDQSVFFVEANEQDLFDTG